ncbi:hypothetical protein PICSAR11_01492 [Mycobacterium avium subsp. paratuberculosis]|nr:hypothetical protein PICSAR11_01492 [Mycobacterium avium subsp. paratuberculosis]CAG7048429.1 hypothetical protein PICSAR18_01547 [Mycobacterium avium subsp. paratuberculosis]CAG7239824.1 hypothetical protein PICSAR5_00796 [Mycobacterium avium subsp. paratuberculosis]CAG7315668.1 hypothetical protein PICSAR64_01560 [Mycobacterium avium subsp. paratuberculosis]CAG7606332.1 hypothetical protein PICSAR136_00940 [Mycobacterium avium subsp. paratuberculosis]
MAGLDQIQHRSHLGGGRGGRGDQDGAGDPARGDAQDAARGRPVAACGLVGRGGVAADRPAALAGARRAAPRRGVVVRDQRHQRACDRRAGPRGRRDRGRTRIVCYARCCCAVGGFGPFGRGVGRAGPPVAGPCDRRRAGESTGRGVVVGQHPGGVRASRGGGGMRAWRVGNGFGGSGVGAAGCGHGGGAGPGDGQDGVGVSRSGLADVGDGPAAVREVRGVRAGVG